MQISTHSTRSGLIFSDAPARKRPIEPGHFHRHREPVIVNMASFIHLADERLVARILKNGIKSAMLHGRRGVYATPVLPDYYVSHQWLRELKRGGVRTIAAVQFRIADETRVFLGRFNEDHVEVTAAESVRAFMDHDTGLGLEVIIPASVSSKAIMQTYTPDQVTGWRYFPESKAGDRKPCGCSYCQRGEIKSRRIREAYERESAG